MNKQYRKLAKLIYKIKTKDDYINALVSHLLAWFKATDLVVNQFSVSGYIKGNYYRSTYVGV